jgi:hypothetical protein
MTERGTTEKKKRIKPPLRYMTSVTETRFLPGFYPLTFPQLEDIHNSRRKINNNNNKKKYK